MQLANALVNSIRPNADRPACEQNKLSYEQMKDKSQRREKKKSPSVGIVVRKKNAIAFNW